MTHGRLIQGDRWWLEDDEHLAGAVCAAAKRVDDGTTARQQTILDAYCLYGEETALSTGVARALPVWERVSHNVLANACDALVSEVTQTLPKPMFTTVGGSWDQHRQAKKLTRWWDAKSDEARMRELVPQIVRDACIAGLGALRPFIEGGDCVAFERVHPINVLVDDQACLDSPPRTLYLRHFYDRAYLAALYPEHAETIERAADPGPRFRYAYDSSRDAVMVVEAWHLPSGDADDEGEDTDGLYVLALEEVVLEVEEYRRKRFPVAFMRAIPPTRGFWGEAPLMRAAPSQLELNTLLRRVQDSMDLHSVPRTFVPNGSINTTKLNNDIGVVVEYTGAQPPVFMAPPAMSPDVWQHIDRLSAWIYEEFGVSRMSATAEKPEGVTAAVAMRALNNEQSRRFVNTERAAEQLVVDAAVEAVHLERLLAKDEPGRDVPYDTRRRLDRVPWSEIDLPDDVLRCRVMPASALPRTPAGRLQALEEMLQRGSIDYEEFLRQQDNPDFEASRDELTAPEEHLRWRLDQMLDGDDYVGPRPHDDPARAVKLVTVTMLKAELDGCPDQRLANFRKWLGDFNAMQLRLAQQIAAQQAAIAPPMPMAPPGGPPGAPEPGMVPPGPAMGPPAPAGPPAPPAMMAA